jgi:hypothetical protein
LRPVDILPETHFLIELAQDTAENLGVGFGGALPDAESAILGVNEAAALDEAEVYVRYSGIASVVLGADGAIVAGDKITTATNGKVKKATSEMYVIGRALTGGDTTNDVIQIRLGF